MCRGSGAVLGGGVEELRSSGAEMRGRVVKGLVSLCVDQKSASEKLHRGRPLLCTSCVEKINTTKNVVTYTCTICSKTGGHGIFVFVSHVQCPVQIDR